MRKKILLFILGLLLGLLIFINYENLNIIYIFMGCLILSLLSIYRKNTLIYMALGIFLIFSFASLKLNSEMRKIGDNGEFNLTVLEKRRKDQGFRYFLRAENGKEQAKVLAFMDEDLAIGESFVGYGKVKLPSTNTNPNLFSYRKYLASKGIFKEIKMERIGERSKATSILLKARNSFYNYIHKTFDNNLSKRSADFVVSVILGENLIENDSIRDLGLSHIIAVSGLHMDMLFFFILILFGRFNYRYAYGLGLFLALIYGYLIGFPFSVIRVLGLNMISFLAFLYNKPMDKIKALLIIGSGILLINPFAGLNAGFILTFAASFAVYLVYPKIKNHFSKSYIGGSLAFTSSIQLALLPFMIYYYGSFNLVSILANFLILPVFSLCMYIIFIIIFAYPLLGSFLKLLFIGLNFLVESILNMTELLNQIKIFALDFRKPHILLAFYGFILIIIMLNLGKNRAKANANIIFLSIMVLIFSLGKERGEISYQMIDIGQGDAFLLNDKGSYYMIDVGGPKYKTYDSGEKILIPYLKSLGIREIEGIFISHEDKDHMGNLDLVWDNFQVNNIYTNKLNENSLRKYKPHILKQGNRIKLKSGYITVIDEGYDSNENANSMGLILDIRGVKIMTLGDLPSEFEKNIESTAHILKLSHHGSKTSTSRDFVERINPKVVLISAGRNNVYGHPHKEVLDNVYDRKIYNSQTGGMVEMRFNRDFEIERFLKGGYFR
ncbi:DNA internalization-related competence protein ComEC/Rec2 [uncultured Anaerococcus sp.]|uniref:DNA internalization-related competence protein ComEC/Rec2 n=1 Tax=uncultured Anaerococcus sp. TaxID=293428 RepID=UPI002805E5D9|nr:DNA internalization-related competence protein ComEC/Rec2 [uncultured Anaerococcus sp.]